MRSSKVTNIGPHTPALRLNEYNSKVFLDLDIGPFWMNAYKRLVTKFDKPTENSKHRDKLKTEMLIDLQKAGVDTSKTISCYRIKRAMHTKQHSDPNY